jgi:SAM-dependent methyltransferase
MEPSDLPEHARRNREHWDRWSEEFYKPGRDNWASDEPDWGIWNVPERELRVLPDVAGKDVLELGCGTAYWSAWLARRGARVVGLDISPRQLENAREFQREFGLDFPLIEGSAEDVPLPADSFDLVLSEYGGSLWCDPRRWVGEAARVLRAGGLLVFMTVGPFLIVCMGPEGSRAQERLMRSYFGLHRVDWPDDPDDDSIEFNLPYSEWVALLRGHGFAIEALVEVQPPEGASTRYDHVPIEWARRWPAEIIWKARKE